MENYRSENKQNVGPSKVQRVLQMNWCMNKLCCLQAPLFLKKKPQNTPAIWLRERPFITSAVFTEAHNSRLLPS